MVTGKKADGIERTARPRTARRATPAVMPRARHRSHSLAPDHIGEAGSVALLALAILGLAIFIAAIAMVVFGVTTASRYASSPPPNVGALGVGQVLGGIGLLVLGLALVGSALSVLADIRGSRRIAAVVSGLAALLAAYGVVRVMGAGAGDAVLAAALAVTTIIFGAAAVILARAPR